MQIQINTGHNVEGSVALSNHIETSVKKALHHLEEHLTRIEVHLVDENGSKGGPGDKDCKIEARPRHHQPIVVSHKSNTLHQALGGAIRKMKSSLEHMFGRLDNQHRRPAIFEDEGSP